jgi:Mrp family chromosome partitioning ATPase
VPGHQADRELDAVDQPITNRPLPWEVAAQPSRRESRSLAQVRSGIARTHHPSFVQLYYALEARRTSSSASMIVQFVSPSARAGVSTIASGYARVAATGRSSPVLFVDASCRPIRNDSLGNHTPTLIEAFESGIDLGEAVVRARNADNLLWSRVCSHPDDLLGLHGDRLQGLAKVLSIKYELVVFDSASIDRPEAAALSRYCDGTMLVLEAGVTSHSQTDAACAKIRQFGGLPIGVVLNRERRAGSRNLARLT